MMWATIAGVSSHTGSRAGSLIGRAAELARLDEELGQLGSGLPRAVEIVGDPGIGKTRLLAELIAGAEQRGIRVISSWAREPDRGVPFAIFADAIAGRSAVLEPEFRAWSNAHGDGLLDPLSPASPRSRSPTAPGLGDRQRCVLYRRLRDLLERCAGESGLLLALDDMHLADAASADLLAYLLHRPPDGPVLIAVAYRPRQLWNPLAGALCDASRHGTVSRIELGPLSRDEAQELLGPTVDRRERDALYRTSEGNPFYLEALRDAQFRSSTGPATPGDGRVTRIPFPVRAAFLAELDMLPDVVRLVARAAAVAGDPVDSELTAAIAGLPRHAVLAALDELRARDVVRDGGAARGLCFRHPLFRHAVYQSAGTGWVHDAHAKAAAFLEDRGTSVVVRAYHVERAARRGDRAAVTLLVDAATQVRVHAPAAAAHWYEAALRLLDDSEPAERRAELLLQLGYHLGVCGEFSRSREALADVLALVPHGTGMRSLCAVFCASLERLLGHHHEAVALLRTELAATPDPTGAAATMLLLELGTHCFVHLQYHEQRLHAARAHSYAIGLGNRLLQASAAVLLALADCGTGELAATRERLAEAKSLVDGLSDAEVSAGPQVFIGLSMTEFYLDRYGDAIRHLNRAIALVHATGQEYTLSPLLTMLADAYLCTGQLGKAAGYAQDALDAALLTGNDQSRMVALARQSEIALWSGDTDVAIQAAEEAAELAVPFTDWLAAAAEGTLAIVKGLLDDPGSRVREFPESYRGIALTMLNPAFQARAYALLVEAEMRQGRVTRAAVWARRARRAAAAFGVPGSAGHASFAEALVLQGCRPAAALRHAQTAVRRFTKVGAKLNAARAALVAADCLCSLGRDAEAAQELRWAEEALRDAGARRFYEQVEAQWRRLHDKNAARVDELVKLSPRELQVARLVADGRSNHEIARALAVTSKTVEAHVSHILGKLGVPSRAAVATIVTRAAHVDRTNGSVFRR
jgi:ATP/maltotriose-dependent transcriptional regulator MalT